MLSSVSCCGWLIFRRIRSSRTRLNFNNWLHCTHLWREHFLGLQSSVLVGHTPPPLPLQQIKKGVEPTSESAPRKASCSIRNSFDAWNHSVQIASAFQWDCAGLYICHMHSTFVLFCLLFACFHVLSLSLSLSFTLTLCCSGDHTLTSSSHSASSSPCLLCQPPLFSFWSKSARATPSICNACLALAASHTGWQAMPGTWWASYASNFQWSLLNEICCNHWQET